MPQHPLFLPSQIFSPQCNVLARMESGLQSPRFCREKLLAVLLPGHTTSRHFSGRAGSALRSYRKVTCFIVGAAQWKVEGMMLAGPTCSTPCRSATQRHQQPSSVHFRKGSSLTLTFHLSSARSLVPPTTYAKVRQRMSNHVPRSPRAAASLTKQANLEGPGEAILQHRIKAF